MDEVKIAQGLAVDGAESLVVTGIRENVDGVDAVLDIGEWLGGTTCSTSGQQPGGLTAEFVMDQSCTMGTEISI